MTITQWILRFESHEQISRALGVAPVYLHKIGYSKGTYNLAADRHVRLDRGSVSLVKRLTKTINRDRLYRPARL